jgi:lipopolysaccharide/colanic/teichoic acid biosynthesis glycosyltransferase
MFYKTVFKPFFDSLLALIFLVCLSPLFFFILIVLFIANNGKPFFYQPRPGLKDQIFNIIKFKTMDDKLDKNDDLLPDNDRLTLVGSFVRKTSLDELPQLINVLKGDMSIVGNRPLPLYEAEQLTSDDWGERFLAPAGITGLWQVEKRGGGSMSEDERKGLDNKYAQNFSFRNDIKLILRTIPALFQKENV